MSPREIRRHRDRGRRARPLDRRDLHSVAGACLRLGDQLRRTRVLEESLEVVTAASVGLTRSLQGTLRLLDDSGKRLLTSARTGPSLHRRGSAPFRLGEGFIGWVVVHHRAALINSAGSDPRFVNRTGQKWTPSGIMAVPLLTPRECIGVLSVSRRDGRRYRPLDLELLQLVGELSVPYLEIARLKRLNESDPLTLLHNRRHLQQRLPEEVQRATRRGEPLAVAMLDLDRFKRINDTFGHEVGDEVLVEFAERLRHSSRTSDVLARWGGEEFLAIFPDTTMPQAQLVGERIRGTIAAQPIVTTAGSVSLTVSIGLAAWKKGEEPQALERRADRALYAAKHSGRNRVVAWSEGQGPD